MLITYVYDYNLALNALSWKRLTILPWLDPGKLHRINQSSDKTKGENKQTKKDKTSCSDIHELLAK